METQQPKPNTNASVNNKQMYIIAAVLAVLLISILSFIFIKSSKKNQQPTQNEGLTKKPQQVIPTVDSSVIVEIDGKPDKKHFGMKVTGIPEGTKTMEYEITYQTKDGGLPGISSSLDIESDQKEYEKEDFLLGTCSTGGKCVYHEVVSPLSVTIKFTGSFGERLYQKDFDL